VTALFFKGAPYEEDGQLPLLITSESVELSVATRLFLRLVVFASGFLKASLSFNPRFRVEFRTRAGKAGLDANLFFEFRRILESAIVDNIVEVQDFF
jgi:hypothetical protein